MKLKRTLNSTRNKVDALIYQLASQDAGKPAKSGMKYKKKISGMNGKIQSTSVAILALEPGRYSVCFEGCGGITTMTYDYTETAPGQVELLYEEVATADKTVGKLNQKVSSFLFSHTAKKQAGRRLDLFEQNLEAMTWPD